EDKCQYFRREVMFLGHTVKASGIAAGPKIHDITRMAPPANQKKLQSFLGYINCFQSYILEWAADAASLYALIGSHFHWTSEAAEAFRVARKL
ncbi:hypothetical protein EDB80DRAFT_533865, partial [Ilyonectria destructans]